MVYFCQSTGSKRESEKKRTVSVYVTKYIYLINIFAYGMFYLEEEENFEECIHAFVVEKTSVYKIQLYLLALLS